MKKLLSLLMVLVLCASFVACAAGGNNKAVEEYVKNNKAALIQSMESSFATSSNMTCDTDVKVEGAGMIFTIKIHQLDNVPSAQKDLMQASYDSMSSLFKTSLIAMQSEVKELEYYEVKVCEKDGDVLATILAGNK